MVDITYNHFQLKLKSRERLDLYIHDAFPQHQSRFISYYQPSSDAWIQEQKECEEA